MQEEVQLSFPTATEAEKILNDAAKMRRWMGDIGKTGTGADIDHDLLAGGTTGQVLTKLSNANYDAGWVTDTDTAPALTNNHIFVGNASNVATDVAMSGDSTIVASGALTLATVNSNVGTFGDAGDVAQITVNAKGLVTAASSVPIVIGTTLLSSDSFNRADSSSTLGSTDGIGSVDPLAWTASALTWGRLGNQAYKVTASGIGLAQLNLGAADVDLNVRLPTAAADGGLLLRFTDTSNYIYVTQGGAGNAYGLWKKVAGVNTSLGTSGLVAHNNDMLRLVAIGSAIKFYLNGSLQISVTDAFNASATRHGLYAATSANCRFDDWAAFSAPNAIAFASGPAGGDLVGLYPNPSLVASGVTAGTYGDSTHIPSVTIDAKGRATTASQVTPLTLPETHSLTGQTADIADTAFTTGNVAGLYRVHYYLLDTTSAIGAGAVTANIKFTDASQAQTVSSSAVVLTTSGAFTQGTIFVQLASGSITYGVTHTGIFSTSQYAAYFTFERLV